MKKNIGEKGITLVSLTVTVLVLMILASIIITTNSKNSGVLNIANNKKEETEKMTIEESLKIELEEDPPESYADLIEFLKNYGQIQNEEVPEQATLVTTKGNYSILVKDIWNMDKQELGVSIGDYVEYSYYGGTYIVDGTYSGTNQNQTITVPDSYNTLWRVIEVNKQSKQIKIIPTNLNDYTVTLSGVNGFNNGVKILNDLCNKVFSNIQYNTSARNINIEDIEKMSSNISELRGTNYGTERKYTSISYPKVISKENDNSIQDEFFLGTENSDNLSHIQTYYSGNIVYSNSNYNDIISEGSYWLSSRAINNNEDAEYYLRTLNVSNKTNLSGTKLFDSKGQDGSNTFNILPVVLLSDVTFDTGYGTQEEPYKLGK